jgi:hypothetical protein
LSSFTGECGTFPYKSDAFGEAVENGVQDYGYDALGRMVTDSGLSDSYTLSYAGAKPSPHQRHPHHKPR